MAKPFIEFVHPDDRERTLAQNSHVRGGGQARLFENRYLAKNGLFRHVMWNSRPDSEHGVIYGVGRDVTERWQAEQERNRLLQELQGALSEVTTLRAFLPICSYCKSVRDDENYWQSLEAYLAKHANTQVTHGVCPTCLEQVLRSHVQKDE
jgi:hypothetical protein